MDIGKDLQDAYECGRQDALNELMEYTYAMLTAEKFGLQHKIRSMMADRKTENCSEIPNNWDEFFREPTAEERKAVADYIDSISVPTGVNVFDLMDEQQTSCKTCRYGEVDEGYVRCAYYSKADCKDEPQTDDLQDWKDRMWAEAVVTEPRCSVNGRPYDCGNCEYHKCTADEPKTDCPWK